MSYNVKERPVLPEGCYKHFDCLPEKYKHLPTPLLQSAKEKGCKTSWSVFAKVNEPSEDVWITVHFLCAVVLFGFSIGFISRGHRTNYDYTRLSFSLLFFIYSSIDAAARMTMRFVLYCSYLNSDSYVDPRAAPRKDLEMDEGRITYVDDGSDIEVDEGRITNLDDGIETANENRGTKNEVTLDDVMNSRNNIHWSKYTYISSKLRFITIDLFLYPMFICHALKYAADPTHEVLDFNYRKFEGTYIILFLGIYFVLVYLGRVVVVGVSLWSIVSLFLPQNYGEKNCKERSKLCCESFCCFKHCYFPRIYTHIILQLIFQMMTFLLIWVAAGVHFGRSTAYYGTWMFWTVVVLGYFNPVIGILSYFVTDCYNTEELLVNITEQSSEIEKSKCFVKLKEQHSKVKKYFSLRVFYSFVSAPLTVLSVTFLVFLSIFLVFVSLSLLDSSQRNNQPWILIFELVYYFFAVIINFRISLTAAIWIIAIVSVVCAIIVAVGVALAAILFVIFGVLLFFFCAASHSDD